MRAPGPTPLEEPEPVSALVVARWNSWVRVWFPDTGESAWIDLREVEYEIAPKPPAELRPGS